MQIAIDKNATHRQKYEHTTLWAGIKPRIGKPPHPSEDIEQQKYQHQIEQNENRKIAHLVANGCHRCRQMVESHPKIEEVAVDGQTVAFTKTEFELLATLLRAPGHVFSRQELINKVWPKDVLVLDRTIDVNITRLRKKIGPYASCLQTRLGYGYSFTP